MTDKKDDFWDDLFADAAAHPPKLRPDFMVQMRTLAVENTPQVITGQKPAFWRDLLQSLGGWPAGAGIALACAAGIAVGMFPPQMITDLFYQPDIWELSGYESWTLEGF
ncbi:MAG: hypothetical protein ACWA40_09420 [Planktomarina sp.]